MSKHDKYLGKECPRSDEIQLMMLVVFLIVWGADSFLLHFTVIPNPVPLFARISFGALVLIISAYMMNESHKLVIDPVDHTFVDYGVFSRARHPMYLGIVLTYFALSVATFSAASFVLWLIYFIIYERFAAFEEHELVEVLVET